MTVNLRFDTDALIAKTLLVEHVIGLVKNEHFELVGDDSTPLDHVPYGSGSANYNRALQSFGTTLSIGRNSCANNESIKELTHDLDDAKNLTGKLSGRGQDQSLRCLLHFLRGQVDTAQSVQNESGGLSGTGLRLTDQILGRVVQ